MKPIDVGDYSFAEYNEESNEKDHKSKVGDHVRISKYKNFVVVKKDKKYCTLDLRN